ncbi:MAG: cupredoxin domain-containing protein [Vicinamibacterales bacterium]
MRRVFVWALFIMSGMLAVSQIQAEQTNHRVVTILAERFSFTPSEIHVAVGTSLELRIHSNDTMHGFRIIGNNVNVLVPKRRQGEAIVRFEAVDVGRYEFECSRLCGAGHNFMRGAIIVHADHQEAER